jgi:hypothetical protein
LARGPPRADTSWRGASVSSRVHHSPAFTLAVHTHLLPDDLGDGLDVFERRDAEPVAAVEPMEALTS